MTPRAPFFFATGFAAALAAGWLAFPRALYERIDQPIEFSHEVHGAKGVGIACEDCHAIGPDGRFAGVPSLENCASCHAETAGESPEEKKLVEEYVKKGREIPWLSYSRQPDSVWFSHAAHVKLAALPCGSCHGGHGEAASLRPMERNRVSGYSRDIWGPSMARIGLAAWQGHKMTDCSACHHRRGVSESCLDCHK
jgi:hypothetical protein